MRRTLTIGLVLAQVLMGSALADLEDLVSTQRAGPFRRGDTTYRQAKDWFGQPDRVTRHRYQCIRVIDARWRDKFRVTFDTFDKTMVFATIKRRVVNSDQHGRLTFHTRKRLTIGDSSKELHRKYPDARRHEHKNFNHHILVSNDRGRLEATTKNGRVIELRSFPYEAC